MNVLHILRTTDKGGSPIWVAFNTETQVFAPPYWSKAELIRKWSLRHGKPDAISLYKGRRPMLRSEAAATIADIQTEKESK